MKLLPFDKFVLDSSLSKHEIIEVLKKNYDDLYEYEISVSDKQNTILIKRFKVYHMMTQNSNLNIRLKIKRISKGHNKIIFFSYLRLMHWIGFLFFSGIPIYIILFSESDKKYYFLPWVLFLYFFGINNDGLNYAKNNLVDLLTKKS